MAVLTPYQIICRQAKLDPSGLAIKNHSNAVSWRDLLEQVTLCANQLSQQAQLHGFSTQHPICLIGKNSYQQLVIYLACSALARPCALLMPQPWVQIEQKLSAIYPNTQDKTRAAWVYIDSSAKLAGEPSMPLCLLDLSASESSDEEQLGFIASALASSDIKNQIASVIFTSGSSGNPKAVAHSHYAHIRSAEGINQAVEFSKPHSWHLSLPMFHVSGLAIVYRWLVAGATLILSEPSEAKHLATHTSMVPVQLERMLATGDSGALQTVLLGGSAISVDLAQQAETQGITTWIGYGLTEAASTVCVKRADGISGVGGVLAHRKIESISGELAVGGETIALGYFIHGVLHPLPKTHDRYLTGDLGYFDGVQWQVSGRKDNMFISGGENIHCEEIERALLSHPQITQAIVIPVADTTYGYRPIALLDFTAPLVSTELRNYLISRIEKFKIPDQFYPFPIDLPQTGIKVSRAEIKSWFEAQSDLEPVQKQYK